MKYIFDWQEGTNEIVFTPSKLFNKGGKKYVLSKISIVEFVLKSDTKEIHSSLGGCLQHIAKDLDADDLINLASVLYTWGMYKGVKG